MSNVLVQESSLQAIAAAIRAKNGGSNTYKPREMADAIRNLSGNPVLQSLNVTENGVYTPETGVDGFSSVAVSVTGGGGGGGGDVALMTKSEWDSLSKQQKHSYGLVAIRTSATGFEQGFLVYGVNYVKTNEYLPYSNEDDVICEAYVSNFDASKTQWGAGKSPVVLTGLTSLNTGGTAVSLPAATSGIYGAVDLGQADTPFTAYIVARAPNCSGYNRLISTYKERSTNGGIMLYGNPAQVSSWADSTITNTGIPSNDYFVGAIQFSGIGSAFGAAANSNAASPVFISKTPTKSGQYVTIGRTDTESSTSNAEPCDLDVKYIAVVKVAESQQTVAANISNLISEFL